jgi:hypothetical protein
MSGENSSVLNINSVINVLDVSDFDFWIGGIFLYA